MDSWARDTRNQHVTRRENSLLRLRSRVARHHFAWILFVLLTTFVGCGHAQTQLLHTYRTGSDCKGYTIARLAGSDGYAMGGRVQTAAPKLLLANTDLVGDERWVRTYEGVDWGDAVAVFPATSGLVVTGSAGVGVGSDVVVVKTDLDGSVAWANAYGGPSGEFGRGVLQHSVDDGIVVAGSTLDGGTGEENVLLLKTDAIGALQWSRVYGGAASDGATCVVEHSLDAGLVIAGWTEILAVSNMLIAKTDDEGAALWAFAYGGALNDRATCLIEYSLGESGELVVGGWTFSFGSGSSDMLVAKTGATGAVIWAVTFGGGAEDRAESLAQHSVDGGLVVAGWTSSSGEGSYDFMLVKADAQGALVWAKTMGGAFVDVAYSAIESPSDAGIALLGTSNSFGGTNSIMLVIQPPDGLGSVGKGFDLGNITLSPSVDRSAVVFGAHNASMGTVVLSLASTIRGVNKTVVVANPSPFPSPSSSASSTSSVSSSSSQRDSAAPSASPDALIADTDTPASPALLASAIVLTSVYVAVVLSTVSVSAVASSPVQLVHSGARGKGGVGVLNLLAFLGVVAVGGLERGGILGKSMCEVTRAYPCYLAPATYFYESWWVIFAALGLFAVRQVRRDSGRVGSWFVVASALHVCWLVASAREWLITAFVAVTLLFMSLIVVHWRLGTGDPSAQHSFRQTLCLIWPFGLYLSWVTVQVAIQGALMRAQTRDGLDHDGDVAAAATLFVLAVAAVLAAMFRGLWMMPLAVAWAALAVAARVRAGSDELYGLAPSAGLVAAGYAAASLALVFGLLAYRTGFFYRRRQRRSRPSSELYSYVGGAGV